MAAALTYQEQKGDYFLYIGPINIYSSPISSLSIFHRGNHYLGFSNFLLTQASCPFLAGLSTFFSLFVERRNSTHY